MWRTLTILVVSFLTVGCRDLSDPTLPDGTQSPDAYYSRQGAVMLSETALRKFRDTWMEVTLASGMITDELGNSHSAEDWVDQRRMPEATEDWINRFRAYSKLHELRGHARLARGVLAEYAADLSPAIRGRLFAFEAYAELWLAELFCSGIPLSTLDYKGDYTYQAGSTTSEVFWHAITLFDSALALSADSATVQTLAKVGKARAYLSLGLYSDAEIAIADVQDSDVYRLRISFAPNPEQQALSNRFVNATVSDGEGGNGLAFRSSNDPRTASPLVALSTGGVSLRSVYFPAKYPAPNDSNWVDLAGGVEAELVKAEAAYHRQAWTTMFTRLNDLRTSGPAQIDTVYSETTPPTIVRIDTTWAAGSGGYAGLRPLTDPGTVTGLDTARLRILFNERAAWLFVDGHRQGDLRRLVREYRWPRDDVYPSGAYVGISSTGLYGNDIDFPVPDSERPNPLFHGCIDRD